MGGEWGAAPVGGESPRGASAARRLPPPHTPHTQAPQHARYRLHSWGGARWGATSTWCALGDLSDFGSAAPEVARARKELPARRLAATQSLRALCADQAAWHPATATQRWLARMLCSRTPFITPRPLDTQPLLAASALAERGESVGVGRVWVWVLDVIKGFLKGKWAFSFLF